jgi:hypothetical protein
MNEHETRPCPYCHELCVRDWAPVRGGLARVGAFGCTNCGSHEITHLNIDLKDFLAPREARTGWFLPTEGRYARG